MTSLNSTFHASRFNVSSDIFTNLSSKGFSIVILKSTNKLIKDRGQRQEQTYMVFDRRFCEATVFSYQLVPFGPAGSFHKRSLRAVRKMLLFSQIVNL